MTLYFLNDVLLLNLALKTAKRILKRLAFLNANLCQRVPPPNLPKRLYLSYLTSASERQNSVYDVKIAYVKFADTPRRKSREGSLAWTLRLRRLAERLQAPLGRVHSLLKRCG